MRTRRDVEHLLTADRNRSHTRLALERIMLLTRWGATFMLEIVSSHWSIFHTKYVTIVSLMYESHTGHFRAKIQALQSEI